jgi:SPX domain protein involved in polyphosphate accumulation
MRFGTTLRKSIYAPWKDKYVDYDRLKKLLKENEGGSTASDDDDQWTADDESAFVDELVNVQLEKVHAFQADTHKQLRDRTTACEVKLDPLAIGLKNENGSEGGASNREKKPQVGEEERQRVLKEALEELDKITKEVNELEKYCRINYTALYKATKKHDRKRGDSYKLRPFLDTRIAALPFNKEDYSPLLYRLSAMYSFVRQSLDGKTKEALSFAESQTGGDRFTSYKCVSKSDDVEKSSLINLQSGSIPKTCSKSRPSFSVAFLSSYTILKPPKLPKALNATRHSRRCTSTTQASHYTRTKSIKCLMRRRFV